MALEDITAVSLFAGAGAAAATIAFAPYTVGGYIMTSIFGGLAGGAFGGSIYNVSNKGGH